ncbi:unnamed protein product [Eruca vesicaria subsp. sativa]|uniref:Uncharacterized protein n=1 Tax=Eruca vesicaria subsp. sativa TaxID=29727 RepID=A0ABC8LQL9_ERUVS|nr:unnamed protein product [Eruca vesicaria subsp. sativa]
MVNADLVDPVKGQILFPTRHKLLLRGIKRGQSRPPPEVSCSSSSQQPWYSPSLVSLPSSSSRPQTSAHVSPDEAAGIIIFLKDKRETKAYASHQKTIDLVKEYNSLFLDKADAIMLDTKITKFSIGYVPYHLPAHQNGGVELINKWNAACTFPTEQ